MRKMRVMLICILAVLTIFGVANIVTYIVYRDSLIGTIGDVAIKAPLSVVEYFDLNKVNQDNLYEDNQIVEIDDYEIKLEEVYLDEENNKGYCRFSVVKENCDMRDVVVREQPHNDQGFVSAMYPVSEKDTRFCFFIVPDMGTGIVGENGGFQQKKDIMYVYYMYELEGDNIEPKPVKYIYLYDKNAGKDYYTEFDSSPNCAVAKFKLK